MENEWTEHNLIVEIKKALVNEDLPDAVAAAIALTLIAVYEEHEGVSFGPDFSD